MSLDRDELAARFFAVILTPLVGDDPATEWDMDAMAGAAVEATDALIARLRPATVAPVADAAPRPEWVRITGPYDAKDVTIGKSYRVVKWCGDGSPVFVNDASNLWGGAAVPVDSKSSRPRWEPCAAPAPLPVAGDVGPLGAGASNIAPPSPAASPAAYVPTPAKSGAAAYVPQVGDVVNTLDSGEALGFDATVVSERDAKGAYLVHYHDRPSGDKIRAFGEPRYLRPATAAERAAAGLPPITPDHPQGGQGAEAEGRVGDQRVAAGLDAPAKEPAFDETSEREAAVDIAKDRGLDVAEEVGFVAGWLARARIAAKGGVA